MNTKNHASLNTIGDLLHWAIEQLNNSDVYFGHGTDNAEDEAEHLLAHLLTDKQRAEDNVLDCEINSQQQQQLIKLLNRRISERMPLPYLLGEAWFAGLPFTIDQRVIVPRSPFAELIGRSFQPWLPKQPSHILDLCCGSGCIGIACAYAFEAACIDLTDLSSAALELAEVNIQRHQLQGRVRALKSDLFAKLSGCRYDLIISNPPYVDQQDLATMPAEYHHEPAMALGSGDDGLDITRRILVEAADYLSEEGLLFVEVGNSWAALDKAFPSVPFMWLEFEFGGHGVFVITRAELLGYREKFMSGAAG